MENNTPFENDTMFKVNFITPVRSVILIIVNLSQVKQITATRD